MIKSKIEWTDSTWNPVSGCRHDCPYCYAKRMAERFGAGWSNISESDIHEMDEPARGVRCGKKKAQVEPYPYDFQPTLHRYRLNQPTKWVKPRTIFVCSMADLFGDWVPDSWIREVMEAAGKAPQHRYLFLTKNPFRYEKYHVPKDGNKWYGTTITSAKEMTRANMMHMKNSFFSIEPMLEDLKPEEWGRDYLDSTRWIILGAESGKRKEKITPEREWVEKITRKADQHGIPVFMKDSMIPIIGEKAMRREFPWEVETLMSPAKDAGQPGDFPTLMSGA